MNIDIHEIKAPGLNESNYGANIDQQFENIDNNFRIIGNYDFIKGQPGDGVKIENVKIVADDNSSSKEIGSLLYKALKTAVESFANKSSEASKPLKEIGNFKWDDIINDENGFYVPIIIHENKVNNTKEYICSAGIVSFFDNRFSATALKQPNIYDSNIVDVTSLLNFKKVNNEWVCDLNLSFPRLKFKDESFYWVINNEETTIKATGLKGERGSNGVMVIGRMDNENKINSGTKVIVKLLVDGKWESKAPDYLRVGDIITVLCPIKDDSTYTYNGFFISNITTIDDTGVYVEYRPEANITQINYSKDTVSFFEALGSDEPVDGAQPARGMFLLFDNFKTNKNGVGYTKNNNSNDNRYAHMIYNDEHKLYVSPVNDYKSKDDFTLVAGTNENDTPQLNINYKTNISKALTVTGATSISGGLAVTSGGAAITGETTISGTTNISGSTNISGATTIQGNGDTNKIVCNKLGTTITGATTIQSTASNGNSLTVNSDGATITGNTSVTGTLTASNKLTVSNGGAAISGTTTITGETTIQSVVTNGKSLTVNSTGVAISGDTEISGKITGSDGLDVTGDLVLTKTFDAGQHEDLRSKQIKIQTIEHNDDAKKYTYLNISNDIDKMNSASYGVQIDSLYTKITGHLRVEDKITGCPNGVTIDGQITGKNKLSITSGGAAIFGTTTITGATAITGDLTVSSGSVSAANGFFQTSDETLKDFHNDIQVDFEKLSLIPKKQFTWKSDEEKHMEIGTSAQEVQKLYPELVSENENGILSVSYDKLSIVALKAIDILNERNKELEQRIEKLEKLIK